MGGTLGDDNMISYGSEKGDESREGKLLCEELIGQFGTLSSESPALRWMSAHWQQVCIEADKDKSGTISVDECATAPAPETNQSAFTALEESAHGGGLKMRGVACRHAWMPACACGPRSRLAAPCGSLPTPVGAVPCARRA